ncbi:hypothetical protein TNCV_4027151 [Trichonephila clavipes]|nr:hypothetical protein TNCV_4027151 [Trichonephila clavipes]
MPFTNKKNALLIITRISQLCSVRCTDDFLAIINSLLLTNRARAEHGWMPLTCPETTSIVRLVVVHACQKLWCYLSEWSPFNQELSNLDMRRVSRAIS